MTQSMTVKDFLNRKDTITDKEVEQYKALSLTIKAAVIVALGLLPMHLSELLQMTNEALQPSVEAYINQFSPSQIIDVLKGVK
jgi:hypothetical protein